MKNLMLVFRRVLLRILFHRIGIQSFICIELKFNTSVTLTKLMTNNNHHLP